MLSIEKGVLPYFTHRQTTIGKISILMGNPIRVAIIECIAKNKSCFDDEFIAKHQISVTVLKKNLRALNKGGLITRFSVGRNQASIYKINWVKLQEFKNLFDEFYQDFHIYFGTDTK
jgi:hypothetical protein